MREPQALLIIAACCCDNNNDDNNGNDDDVFKVVRDSTSYNFVAVADDDDE